MCQTYFWSDRLGKWVRMFLTDSETVSERILLTGKGGQGESDWPMGQSDPQNRSDS